MQKDTYAWEPVSWDIQFTGRNLRGVFHAEFQPQSSNVIPGCYYTFLNVILRLKVKIGSILGNIVKQRSRNNRIMLKFYRSQTPLRILYSYCKHRHITQFAKKKFKRNVESWEQFQTSFWLLHPTHTHVNSLTLKTENTLNP